jgi:hypothetical protein
MYRFFKLNGSKPEPIYISVPINIRDRLPKTVDEVELTNKVTGFILELPLISDFKEGITPISEMYNSAKKSAEYYSNYIFSCMMSLFVPSKLSKLFINQMTREVALVFTNVPGPT